MAVKFAPQGSFNTVDRAIVAAVKIAEIANDVVLLTWNEYEFPVYKSAEIAAYTTWAAHAYKNV